jgi:hypothetical protein
MDCGDVEVFVRRSDHCVRSFPKPEPATPADRFLMEGFFAYGYRGVELRNLNHWRLHLHALRLSDLCTAAGRRLTSEAREVQLDKHRQSPFTWPRTHRPEFAIRSLWRSALTKSFLRSTDSQVLVHPLGQYTSNISSTWLWKYLPTEQRLFVPYNRRWTFYHIVSGRRQSANWLYHHGGTSNALPPDSRAATVSIHGPLVRLISFGVSALASQVNLTLSFLQILDSLPAPLIWAVQEYALPSDLGPIVCSLSLGTSQAIIDGSYKDKFGASAFTILDNQDNSILGLNVVPVIQTTKGHITAN